MQQHRPTHIDDSPHVVDGRGDVLPQRRCLLVTVTQQQHLERDALAVCLRQIADIVSTSSVATIP